MARKSETIPCDNDAEKGVLCSLLLSRIGCAEVCQRHGCKPEWFDSSAHRLIYLGIMTLIDHSDDEPDCIRLTQHLRAIGKLAECGGAAYIMDLYGFVPTAANVESYLAILKDCWIQREALNIALRIADECRAQKGDPSALVLSTIGDLESLLREDGQRIIVGTERAINDIQSRRLNRALFGDGILKTGITPFDKSFGGARGGREIVLGARPGVGKSALMETAQAGIMAQDGAILSFQRDMRVEDQIARMACRSARLIFEDYDLGRLDGEDMERFDKALAELNPELLRIYSPENMTTSEIRSTLKAEMRRRPIKAVFIDVFTRIKVHGNDYVQGLSRASNDLRDLCNDFDVFLMIAAHMNKDADKTGRPHAGQFKYCDQLFSDCDAAALMWSDEDPADEDMRGKRQKITLSIDKNRGGEVGNIYLYFDRPHMTFHDKRE